MTYFGTTFWHVHSTAFFENLQFIIEGVEAFLQRMLCTQSSTDILQVQYMSLKWHLSAETISATVPCSAESKAPEDLHVHKSYGRPCNFQFDTDIAADRLYLPHFPVEYF